MCRQFHNYLSWPNSQCVDSMKRCAVAITLSALIATTVPTAHGAFLRKDRGSSKLHIEHNEIEVDPTPLRQTTSTVTDSPTSDVQWMERFLRSEPPCTAANKQKALYIAYEMSPTLDESPATALAVETTWVSVSRMRAYGKNGVFAAQVSGARSRYARKRTLTMSIYDTQQHHVHHLSTTSSITLDLAQN